MKTKAAVFLRWHILITNSGDYVGKEDGFRFGVFPSSSALVAWASHK